MNRYIKKTVLLLAVMSLGLTTTPASAAVTDFRIGVDGVWSYVHDPDQLNYLDGKTVNGGHADRYYNSYTRVKLYGRIDPNFTFTTRIHSGYFCNGDNISTYPSSKYNSKDRTAYLTDTGNNPFFDQAYFTYRNRKSNFRMKVGMQGAYLGQGMVYDASGKLQGFGLQFGDYRDHTTSYQVYYGNRQGGEAFKAVDVSTWITPKLNLTGTFVGYRGTTRSNKEYNNRIYSYGTQYKIDKNLTFAAEKSRNVNGTDGANVDSGYYMQVYTGPTSDFADGLARQKVGTDATVLTYQNIGQYSVVQPIYGMPKGEKGWRIGYGKVIAKGIAASIEYADMQSKPTSPKYKPQDAKMTKFQISYCF